MTCSAFGSSMCFCSIANLIMFRMCLLSFASSDISVAEGAVFCFDVSLRPATVDSVAASILRFFLKGSFVRLGDGVRRCGESRGDDSGEEDASSSKWTFFFLFAIRDPYFNECKANGGEYFEAVPSQGRWN